MNVTAVAQIPSSVSQAHRAIISGTFIGKTSTDSVSLYYWDDIVSKRRRSFTVKKELREKVNNGSFRFEIDKVTALSYMTVETVKPGGAGDPILELYIVAPGDSIHVKINRHHATGGTGAAFGADNGTSFANGYKAVSFTGRGAFKYQARYELDQEISRLQTEWNKTPIATSRGLTLEAHSTRLYDNVKLVVSGGMSFLQKYKAHLQAGEFDLLSTDMAGKLGELYFRGMSINVNLAKQANLKKELDDYRKLYKKRINFFPFFKDSMTLAKSSSFSQTLLLKLKLENSLFYGQDIYKLIKEKYHGSLGEKLLANYLLDNNNAHKIDSLLSDGISCIKSERYSGLLQKMLNNQKTGMSLRDYVFSDSAGSRVKLDQFKGKTIFLDIWFTGCGGCMRYYKECVSRAEERFKDHPDLVFVTISTDTDKTKWLEGLRSGKYTSSQAINLYTNGQGTTHPIIKQLNIIAYPFSVIVDKDGNLLINDVEQLRSGGPDVLIATINRVLEKMP